jgi:hypothetical protein
VSLYLLPPLDRRRHARPSRLRELLVWAVLCAVAFALTGCCGGTETREVSGKQVLDGQAVLLGWGGLGRTAVCPVSEDEFNRVPIGSLYLCDWEDPREMERPCP